MGGSVKSSLRRHRRKHLRNGSLSIRAGNQDRIEFVVRITESGRQNLHVAQVVPHGTVFISKRKKLRYLLPFHAASQNFVSRQPRGGRRVPRLEPCNYRLLRCSSE